MAIHILIFLLLYCIGVYIYTIIVKNSAIYKFSPFTNVKEIAKDGAIRLAIGLIIVVVIYFIITGIITLI
jgi:hypothetical protein